MSESVLIVGGGVAGLAAGCYAQMNGYRSQIFEMDIHSGGLCTTWKRSGYAFECGLRVLSGIGVSQVHPVWEELGMAEGRRMYYYDEFRRYEGADGRAFRVYTNIDRLEQHMLELAPEDRDVIEEFAHAVRQFTRMELPADLTPSDLVELIQLGQDMLPVALPVLRWRGTTVGEFATRFRDPLLREALPQIIHLTSPECPMIMLLSTLANMNDKEAGFPIGGSARFSDDLASQYVSLGGQIHLRARVEKILVEAGGNGRRGGRAVGVRLADGSEHRGDVVISAADGHTTIFDLLEGRYLDESVRSYYRDLPVAQCVLKISLGVARDLSNEPPEVDFPLRQPVTLGNREYDRLVLRNYCFDPTMAPSGKSVLGVWLDADYDYWTQLRADRQQYRTVKKEVADRVITALGERYPGFADVVEAVDVATPATYERMTGNWRGAFSGWALTTRKFDMMMNRGMRKTLPDLENFYMIGQWVEPGGSVEFSTMSGRDVIKELCRVEDQAFNTDRLRPVMSSEAVALPTLGFESAESGGLATS